MSGCLPGWSPPCPLRASSATADRFTTTKPRRPSEKTPSDRAPCRRRWRPGLTAGATMPPARLWMTSKAVPETPCWTTISSIRAANAEPVGGVNESGARRQARRIPTPSSPDAMGYSRCRTGREPPTLSRRGPLSIQPGGFSAPRREHRVPPHYPLTPPHTVVGRELPTDPAGTPRRPPVAITAAARMSQPGLGRAPGCGVGFADTRAKAARAEADQHIRAARLVAGNSLDVNDCRELLSMLGLTVPRADTTPAPHTRPSPGVGNQYPGFYRDTSNAFHSTEGARA